MIMREFSAEDWTAWSGAEPWENSEPHIGHVREGYCVVIADATGVGIYWFNPEGELAASQIMKEEDRDASITAADFIAKEIEAGEFGARFAYRLATLGVVPAEW